MTLKEGPRHMAWRNLKDKLQHVRWKIEQFNSDLASVKQNKPACADLAIEPLVDNFPDMPDEPSWTA